MIELSSKITSAIVYRDRALVTRIARCAPDAGKRAIRIIDLPQDLQKDSIRVVGKAQFPCKILDVKVRTEYLAYSISENVLKLEEEKEVLNEKIALNSIKIKNAESKRSLIQSIKVASSDQFSKDLHSGGVNLEQWSDSLHFVGEQISIIEETIFYKNRENEKLLLQLQKIEYDLERLKSKKETIVYWVEVEIDLQETGGLELEVSYQTSQASWSPIYDARMDLDNKKVNFLYAANIIQKTGENWENILLKCSTAAPHIGGNPPEIKPIYLRVFEPRLEEDYNVKAKKVSKELMSPLRSASAGAPPPPSLSLPLEEEEAMVEDSNSPAASVVFIPPGKHTIPGDGSTTKVRIVDLDWLCELKFYSVPRLSPYVYVQTEIVNASVYPLLPGKISIFNQGNFLAVSNLVNLVSPDEKFILNLGIDENMKVERKMLQNKNDEKGIFSKDKSSINQFQIHIKNQRRTNEKILVRDQIPVSTHEKIKVILKKIDPEETTIKSDLAQSQGVLEWYLPIASMEEKMITFEYHIIHPSEIQISGF